MITKDAYKQKIASELKLTKKRLDDFKVLVKKKNMNIHNKYEQEIINLEKRIEDMKSSLVELSEEKENYR